MIKTTCNLVRGAPQSTSPVSRLMFIGLVKVEIQQFHCNVVSRNLWSNGYVTTLVGAPQSKSPVCHVRRLQVLWWDITFSFYFVQLHDNQTKRILWFGKQQPLTLSQHPMFYGTLNTKQHCTKFDAFSSNKCENIFLFCHMTTRDHMIKRKSDLV